MMSGPEHYCEAERSLERAKQLRRQQQPAAAALCLAEAGVHAQLAGVHAQLAGVQAAILPAIDHLDGHPAQEWAKVARPE